MGDSWADAMIDGITDGLLNAPRRGDVTTDDLVDMFAPDVTPAELAAMPPDVLIQHIRELRQDFNTVTGRPADGIRLSNFQIARRLKWWASDAKEAK